MKLKPYRSELSRALSDEFLRRTLEAFAVSWAQARKAAVEEIGFEAAREELARTKDSAISRMEELAALFTERARAAGAVVHRAATGAEARRIIERIAREAGAGLVVKSKSMTAEEIGLNAQLEAAGMEVVETDLGEWIIQLRGEGPSHMVLPAIHLSRAQVARVFRQKLGEQVAEDDIEAMVRLARVKLREKFFSAQVGITGANIAIASSGTLVMVTNEGNGRLVATLPRVQIALVGLEKLVETEAEALKILELLPRSATAQRMSSYVSWITGPGQGRELHIVLLDNGRSALARDPVLREALRCIRCGACANLCPVYRRVGGHRFGHIYIGAIGLVLTAFYHGLYNAEHLLANCLRCGICKQMCPAGINLPRLINAATAIAASRNKPRLNRLMHLVLPRRELFHTLLRTAALATRPLQDEAGMLRHLPLVMDPSYKDRPLPALAPRPLRAMWPERVLSPSRPRARVGLFAGCLVEFVYPEQAEALKQLLAGQGVELIFPKAQSCCGLPALVAGEPELARTLARQNLAALDPGGLDYIVVLCPTCGAHMREGWVDLVGDESGWGAAARAAAGKILDAASLLVALGIRAPRVGDSRRITYHSPCHLCRGMGITQEPRQLLRQGGYTYIPGKAEDACCGFGGSYSLRFPELSVEIMRSRLADAAATGAQILATDCPGCVLQLRAGARKFAPQLKVLHLVEALKG